MDNWIFKRKIYDDLLRWKNRSNGRSALLIEGARRVGKTSIAEEFARNEFPAYTIVDFSKEDKDVIEAFNSIAKIDKFFQQLFVALGIRTLPKGSLIIFDEVQCCPRARQAIKALVEDRRYFYIETGSLISIKENVVDILIPSEEESIQMYPMDYEEFLWACGTNLEAETIREYYENNENFPDSFHDLLMKNFRTYLAVGGMPSVVSAYVERKDFYEIDDEKKQILQLYENDLTKIDAKYGTICSLIYKFIPKMLSHQSKRFILSSINERADSVKIANTMEKLIQSKLVIPVYRCSDPTGGFVLTKDLNAFKLYFNDVGLFTSIVYANNKKSEDIYKKLIFDDLNVNLGMLCENYVAQVLLTKGYEPYYYSWIKRDNGNIRFYEIDFIISEGYKTIPIEVKSGKIESLASLDEFKKKYSKYIKLSYVVYQKQLKTKDNNLYIPFYSLFAL